MSSRLDPLGYARVFRDPESGKLVVDTDTLRRGGFAGSDDIGEEEVGEDDDVAGEEYEGDEEAMEGDDDFGARGRRRRKKLGRRLNRLDRREDRVRDRLEDLDDGGRKKGGDHWGMTAVAGTDVLTAPGSASVKIRLQHDFRAQDITFTGSAAGAKVTSIFFGDRVVWSSSDGIDAAVFGSTSLLRGLLKGQSLRAGLDITVNGELPGPGDFAVTLVGEKPVDPHC